MSCSASLTRTIAALLWLTVLSGLTLATSNMAHAENPRAQLGEVVVKALKKDGDEAAPPRQIRPDINSPGPVYRPNVASPSQAVSQDAATLLNNRQGGFFEVDEFSASTRNRIEPGADGGDGLITVERVDGNATSVRHTVTLDDKVIHQHIDHVGSAGSHRRFSDDLTGTRTIGDPPNTDTYADLTKKSDSAD